MYRMIVIFSVVVAMSSGVAVAGILGQYHSQNEVHDYVYGYHGGPSAKHESKIHNVVKGGYSYVDANGKLQTVNYTSDEHGFKVHATNLPTKLGHAIVPENQSHPYYAYPSYYPVPPPANPPQVTFVPVPAPVSHSSHSYPVFIPIDHHVPAVIDAHKRSRRNVYPSYAPVRSLKHSSIALESTYNPVAYAPLPHPYSPYGYDKPAAKPAGPTEYVEKPSYEPKYSYARSHIPIQEETYDIPEEKTTPVPAAAIPAARLFVPVPTTPAPTPATTTPPVYQPYYTPSSADDSPSSPTPSLAPTPAPASPSPASVPTTPAPAPVAEVYIRPLVKHYSPAPNHYVEPRYYEHVPHVPHVPAAAPSSPSATTLPPTTAAPTPAHVETYYIPHEARVPSPPPAPLPVEVKPIALPDKPVPAVHAAPLPAVIATAIRSQFHSQDELGQYTYGYANEISSKHEIKTADGITQGGYSYVDANGHLQQVHYVSDDHHGFRVAATNLPKGPVPVPHDAVVPVLVAEHKK